MFLHIQSVVMVLINKHNIVYISIIIYKLYKFRLTYIKQSVIYKSKFDKNKLLFQKIYQDV